MQNPSRIQNRPPACGPIHPRAVLVLADTVASIRGISQAKVLDMVDGGFSTDKLLWVWNVGIGREKRSLRFWAREIDEPRTTDRLSLENVIRLIVPRRELPGQFCGLRQWELEEMFRINRTTLILLRHELSAQDRAGDIYIPRDAIENFLRRRWCGNVRPHQTRLV